jgi:hypothetical protein
MALVDDSDEAVDVDVGLMGAQPCWHSITFSRTRTQCQQIEDKSPTITSTRNDALRRFVIN